MRVPSHPTLVHRMCQARVKQLVARRPVLGASLVQTAKRCAQPGCHCQKGKGHPKNYLTFKVGGKTKTVYVPFELIPEVRLWIQEHRRLKNLSQEISQLVIAQVQTHVRTKRRKAGRP